MDIRAEGVPTIHFISGLPRSGSTLLAALLRQNPKFKASVQSPMADLTGTVLRALSTHESGMFVDDGQRAAILRGLLQGCYSSEKRDAVIFDSGRAWASLLPTVAAISPHSKVICMLRNPAWILDSIERLFQRNHLHWSRLVPPEATTVFARADSLARSLLGPPVQGMKQAWFGDYTRHLIAIRYESLATRPGKVIAALYGALEQPLFVHDFDRVSWNEPEFDGRLETPDLHRVSGPVVFTRRETILPPELFKRFDEEFWSGVGSNPRQVTLL